MPDRPVVPLALGAAGLLPFLAGTAAAFALPEWRDLATSAVMIYGAVILSFLGGVHWGRALHRPDAAAFLWGVSPSLIAFFATFASRPVALAILSAGFVAAGLVDIVTFRREGPPWYVGLRIALTAVVTFLLALASWAATWGAPA